MNSLRLVGFSGSTRRPSRTTQIVDLIGRRVSERSVATFDLYDLVSAGPSLGAFSRTDLAPEAEAVEAAIEGADALVVGSPTYKGSYSGLFKHLIDFVDPAALAGKPVVLVATGGGRRHALTVEHGLRPLFGFFSALTAPTSVYASDEDFEHGTLVDSVTLARIEAASDELVRLSRARPAADVTHPALDRVA